ncbi:hypothetical protein B0H11DRAFT_1877798 [Mycena galericulata]|nr:hypothetical protein B0H11DRAFT_1877798 [Mycena galericulata]
MRTHPPTRFDLSPSNLVASTSTLPQTPSRRRGRDEDDENIHPELWSPSKKMRTLYAHLGSTTAGSLLLSSPKIKSYDNPILPPVIQHVPRSIPMPDWSLATPEATQEPYKTRGQLEVEISELKKQLSLAHQNVAVRDQIIEEANATMVFQNMGLKKTNEALHQQEEKTKTDRARLFKGKAQCLSSDEFQQAVEEIEAEKKTKAAGKEAKKAERQRRKEMKEELEKEWVGMKQRHAVDVEEWSTKCSELTAEGVKKKDLPPKPKLGKKPQVPAADGEEEDEEEEPADEDDV